MFEVNTFHTIKYESRQKEKVPCVILWHFVAKYMVCLTSRSSDIDTHWLLSSPLHSGITLDLGTGVCVHHRQSFLPGKLFSSRRKFHSYLYSESTCLFHAL